eukprot:TRINITY_DN16992_c0_g1_i3.p2 TRINITY_DN16992_c0_g1~~TRINITY_DN16992_c0_g1_i3.p2  ORF type:complete len:206 (-),score=58.43 TRINITY_DN16992_c0_g1_i3:271-888(-)
MIRRPPRSTLSSSSAASDVYKRQVDWNSNLPCNAIPAARTIADHLLLHNPIFKELMSSDDGMIVPAHFLSTRSEEDKEARNNFLNQAELFNAFTPMVRHVGDLVLNNEMDEGSCPFLPNFRDDVPKNDKKRSGSKSWWSRSKANTSSSGGGAGPLVIFVLGGITYAEIQAAYELMAKHSIDVYIGGTHLLTATSFIEKGLDALAR